MNRKAISLMSGGLDSTLAAKLILEQGIEVVALHFTTPFASRKEKDRGRQAVRTAEELGIKIILKDEGMEYIDIVRNPGHGYGKNINPCIDCKIFMLQKSRALMAEEGASFVITGEVLGQRPMSQRRDTIMVIEKASGLQGLIVRPLSAIHFSPTIPEIEGLIDRDKLLDITGRSRAVQYKLAEKYHLKEYGCPGGGCLLTDPIFTDKLRDLFKYDKTFTLKDVELLSVGRHFRLRDNIKLIVGRNEGENEKLMSMWEPPYACFYPVDFSGPSAIMKGPLDADIVSITANIIGHYGKNTSQTILIESNNGMVTQHAVERSEFNPDAFKIQEAR